MIVGAGSAGCVLAARLSEDPSRQVVLVEVGPRHAPPDLGDATVIPALHPDTWQYTASLTPERTAPLHRGRVVGGSGAVNGGYFARATAADVDAWPGLSFAELLPSFVRSETDLDFPGPAHGSSGPLPIRRRAELHPGSEQFLVAARDAGFGEVADLNDPAAGPGVGRLPLNIRDGVRVDAASAYLRPRPNLRVLTATVHRVTIVDGRATGVELADGARLPAEQVLLCAGAIESAHLLLASGMGPAADLRALGIEVHADLPVGQEFSDHPDVAVAHLHAEQTRPSGVPGLEVVLSTPTVELRPYTASFADLVPGSHAGPQPCVGVALVAPESRGCLTLRSIDPSTAPRIAHHYLASTTDRQRLADGVRLAHELLRQAPPKVVDAWIAANLGTSQHLVGTCALGRVVDERFAVHGIGGLHVVDASVIPTVPSRGPHATVIAVAEHAAQSLGSIR